MATQRQIDANRQNALSSTGPRTVEGRARSRANAIKHGMAAEELIGDNQRADFDDRRARWAEEIAPSTAEGEWAFDRAVAASFRIERCERALDAAVVASSGRACLAWDLDRAADAAKLAEGLARHPETVSARLQTTKHGAELLARHWGRLGEAIDANRGWSDAEVATALDMLGVPAHLRAGSTQLDPSKPGVDLYEFRRGLIVDEIRRLTDLIQSTLGPADASERGQAETGASGLLTKPAMLILRYERDAWRTYRAAIKEARAATPAPIALLDEGEAEDDEPPMTAEDEATVADLRDRMARAVTPEEVEAVEAAIDAAVAARTGGVDGDEAPIPMAKVKADRGLNRKQRRAMAAQARRA